MIRIAFLLTCHNRKNKTVSCLNYLYSCNNQSRFIYDVYLVDDGSTDGTSEEVLKRFSNVNIIEGDGNLYWAGGMRLAWEVALKSNIIYNYFILLNDDTQVYNNFFEIIFNDINYLNTNYFIIVGSTLDPVNNKISYGGRRLLNKKKPHSEWVYPNNSSPQPCDLGNANIMLVSNEVVNRIGILSQEYIHGIADFDYTLNAKSKGIDVVISSQYLGSCENDHGNNWLSKHSDLKKRIKYLYSVTGLSYKNYLYFIRKHFPAYLIEVKIKLWLKTFVPFIWDVFKKHKR